MNKNRKLQQIAVGGGLAAALAMASACAPQLAQTQYSPAEQQWEQYLRTNYPEWRPPQTVPPMAGVAMEPGMDVVPEFVPGEGVALPPLPPYLDDEFGMNLAPAASQTYVVQKGDSLWSIAAKFYGKGHLWKQIHEANLDRIPDPARLRAGTELIIPDVGGGVVVPK